MLQYHGNEHDDQTVLFFFHPSTCIVLMGSMSIQSGTVILLKLRNSFSFWVSVKWQYQIEYSCFPLWKHILCFWIFVYMHFLMHQSFVATAPPPPPPPTHTHRGIGGLVGDSRANVRGSDLLSSRACDIMQIYPCGIHYYKEQGYASQEVPAVQGCDGWKVVVPAILRRWWSSGYKWLVHKSTMLKTLVISLVMIYFDLHVSFQIWDSHLITHHAVSIILRPRFLAGLVHLFLCGTSWVSKSSNWENKCQSV